MLSNPCKNFLPYNRLRFPLCSILLRLLFGKIWNIPIKCTIHSGLQVASIILCSVLLRVLLTFFREYTMILRSMESMKSIRSIKSIQVRIKSLERAKSIKIMQQFCLLNAKIYHVLRI